MALGMSAKRLGLVAGAIWLLAGTGVGTTGLQTQVRRPGETISARTGSEVFEEVTVKADAVIGVRLETPVRTSQSKPEDRVVASIVRDVRVDGRTAIPAGARLEGDVTLVQPAGKFKTPGRIGVRFTTLLLDDGKTRLPIDIEPIYRSSEPPGPRSAARIGAGAIVGALLGAVVGGKKGAAIGGAAGAAGGTAAVAAADADDIAIPAGTPLTVRLSTPFKILVERQ